MELHLYILSLLIDTGLGKFATINNKILLSAKKKNN